MVVVPTPTFSGLFLPHLIFSCAGLSRNFFVCLVQVILFLLLLLDSAVPRLALGKYIRNTQSWESFHRLCNSEAGQRLSAVTLQEPPRCLSISPHTFTHELPPLCVFLPLPAQKTCHAVCVSTPTQAQLSAPRPLRCQRQHPVFPPASRVGSFPCKRSNLLCEIQATSHPPNRLMLADIFCWSIYGVSLIYENQKEMWNQHNCASQEAFTKHFPRLENEHLTRQNLFCLFDCNEELTPDNSIKTTYMRAE